MRKVGEFLGTRHAARPPVRFALVATILAGAIGFVVNHLGAGSTAGVGAGAVVLSALLLAAGGRRGHK